MGFISIAKPFTITVFVGLGATLEGRVALGPAGEPAFGSPGRPPAGFWRLRGRTELGQKRRNYAMDAHRCQASGVVVAFPGQPQVRHVRSRQPKLLSWVKAATSHVHRSACSGWRTLGVVHPMLCLRKRKVCSRSKRLT
jgi:hypothetical protein